MGHGLIKIWIARPGKGKSGGYRVLLAYRSRTVAVFLYGFAKSDRDNIDDDELELFRERADQLLSDMDGIEALIAGDKMREASCDQD